jgi:NitT/TauT family transport system substrate-binding protein
MMKRSSALIGLGCAALVPSTLRAQTPIAGAPITLASNASDEITNILYAIDRRLFSGAGLNVEIARMNNGAAVTEAVVGGSVDIGSASLLPIVVAHARGLPISLIAAGGLWLTEHPVAALIVPKESTVVNARDLEDKTIGVVGLKDLTDVALTAWVDLHGGDAHRLRLVELPGASALPALSAGRIDAMVLSVPFLADVLASGQVRVIGWPNDAIAKRFLISAWFTTTAYARANRAVVERFALVARKAATYTNAHHAETLSILSAFSGMAPERLARMERATVGLRLDESDIQPVIDVAAKYALISHRFDAKELIGVS